MDRSGNRRGVGRPVAIAVVVGIFASLANVANSGLPAGAAATPSFVARSLDGSGNNAAHAGWGQAASNYLRIAAANYANGKSTMASGPNARYISNRIFNDTGQNLFSENNISQWGWAWGQFLDHDMGLRNDTPAEAASVSFASADPLEEFSNDTGAISFNRTPAAPGTGGTNVRQQVNTLSSYIDASNVYGVSAARLDWLRVGKVDGNPQNNGGALLMQGSYLPRVTARGNAATAPGMELQGALMGTPDRAIVAGDRRANENLALTAIQTLFAREHNRIVAALPSSLSGQTKFTIARRIVGAEVQHITYTEFLPALGVTLGAYTGYRKGVNAGLSNEFATVGYRAHSMVHGEFEVTFVPGTYSPTQLAAFTAKGIEVTDTASEHLLVVPLSVTFGNPDLLQQIGLGAVLASIGAEAQYKNDEQIDDTMRSILFQFPKPGSTDPAACQTPIVNPECFTAVADLGIADLMRSRDHGMPKYNAMRKAYGLAPKTSFTAITGETNSTFPAGLTINDPTILDVIQLRARNGNVLDMNSPAAETSASTAVRRTSLAARLKAVYGTPDQIDAFVGMMAERHIKKGIEFGELQLAIWKDQFTRLRDGDRFFYEKDAALAAIKSAYNIGFRHSLADLIELNTPTNVLEDVFHAAS